MVSQYLLILSVVSSLALMSCSTCEPGPALYARGSVAIQVNSSGALESAKQTTNMRSLSRPGESFPIQQGVPFLLTIPKIVDLGTYSLVVSEFDSATRGEKWFRVSLRESCRPYIIMDKQCKIVNWYNPYRLPEVRVQASDDQLIVTPLLDRSSSIIGYEIRLGDSKICESPALDALRAARTKQQIKGGKVVVRRPTTADKPMDIAELFDFKIGS